jgi:DNA-binding protein YbaB
VNTPFDQQIASAMRLVNQELDTAHQRQDAIAETVGRGVSEDGLVTVEVRSGVVHDLELNPRALRLDSRSLRDSILQAIAAATADYTESVRALVPGPSLDPERLLHELGGEGQAGSMLGDFHRRVADLQYNLDRLRRDLKSV